MISTKSSRPYTAMKSWAKNNKNQSKILISSLSRPATFKNYSLKKIIQVIQNTLNEGAQGILSRAKTLDRYSKMKNVQESNSMKYFKKHFNFNKETPEYKTYHAISMNSVKSFSNTMFSSTQIFHFVDNEQFVPYMKKNSIRLQNDDLPKKEKMSVPLKKVKRTIKIEKKCQKQSDEINEFKLLDQWQNDKSQMNLSSLLDNSISRA